LSSSGEHNATVAGLEGVTPAFHYTADLVACFLFPQSSGEINLRLATARFQRH
jgi:hypothetical protein